MDNVGGVKGPAGRWTVQMAACGGCGRRKQQQDKWDLCMFCRISCNREASKVQLQLVAPNSVRGGPAKLVAAAPQGTERPPLRLEGALRIGAHVDAEHCRGCGKFQASEADRWIICQDCGDSFHLGCAEHAPSLEHPCKDYLPPGCFEAWNWLCSRCRTHSATDSVSAQVLQCRDCHRICCADGIVNGYYHRCDDCKTHAECLNCSSKLVQQEQDLFCSTCKEMAPCPRCFRRYSSNDYSIKMVECDGCASWTHIECAGISDDQYGRISETNDTFSFKCVRCQDAQSTGTVEIDSAECWLRAGAVSLFLPRGPSDRIVHYKRRFWSLEDARKRIWYTIRVLHDAGWNVRHVSVHDGRSVAAPSFEAALALLLQGQTNTVSWKSLFAAEYYERLREHGRRTHQPTIAPISVRPAPRPIVLPKRDANGKLISSTARAGRPKPEKAAEDTARPIALSERDVNGRSIPGQTQKTKPKAERIAKKVIRPIVLPGKDASGGFLPGKTQKKRPKVDRIAGEAVRPIVMPERDVYGRFLPGKTQKKRPKADTAARREPPLTPPLSPEDPKARLPEDGCARIRPYVRENKRTALIATTFVTVQREKSSAPSSKYNNSRTLIVSRSQIAGLGLYTTRLISAATRILEYCGEIVGQLVADRRERMYALRPLRRHDCYLFRLSNDRIVDATLKANIARFINHSCDPNCEARIVGQKIIILALREILPGEELTYDYKFSREKGEAAMPCCCGAPNCRKYMN